MDAPSKVVHLRNLSDSAADGDVTRFCAVFGAVERIVHMKTSHQALVQMGDIQCAIALVSFYTTTSPIMMLANGAVAEPIKVQFSKHMQLTSAPDKTGAPGPVLRCTMRNVAKQYQAVSMQYLHQLFSQCGPVLKIVMSPKPCGDLQVFCQFGSIHASTVGLQALANKQIYLGDPSLNITIEAQYSNLSELIVKQQSERTRDFCQPMGTPIVPPINSAALSRPLEAPATLGASAKRPLSVASSGPAPPGVGLSAAPPPGVDLTAVGLAANAAVAGSVSAAAGGTADALLQSFPEVMSKEALGKHKISDLQKRARQWGVHQDTLDDAADEDQPKACIISLILAAQTELGDTEEPVTKKARADVADTGGEAAAATAEEVAPETAAETDQEETVSG